MRSNRGLTSATKRLRGFWLAAAAVLASAGLALLGFLSANSSADGSASEIDNYIQLDGTSQCAASPDRSQFDLTANFTIESWIFPTSAMTAVEAMIINKEDSYEVAIRSGTFQYAIYGTVNAWDWRDTGIRAKADQWQHFAFTKASNTVTLYIDGVSVYTLTNSTFANTSIKPSNLAFNVGCRAGTAGTSMGAFFGGRLDEVRLWTVARSQPDIARDMHLNKIAGASGLVGYWDFNEPSGTSVYDRSSLNGTLTLYGSPTRLDVKQIGSALGGDTVITFPRTYLPGVGGWQIPTGSANVRALVIAGGGGGGAPADSSGWSAGGGGAGGLLQANISFSTASLQVTVGQGGVGGIGANQGGLSAPFPGQSSQFGTLSSVGGGAGGGWHAIQTGGSGGGGAMYGGTAALGTAGQGNSGGAGASGHAAGGGGGAGGAGGAGVGTNTSTAVGGAGGAGVSLDLTGTTRKYAWGGIGAGFTDVGLDWNTQTRPTTSVTPGANTGAGGSGGRHTPSFNVLAGAGASGVIIVRYTDTKDLAFEPSTTDQATATDIIPTAAASSFSVEAWVYPTSLTGWKSVLNQSPSLRDGLSRHFIGINDGVLHFIANGGTFVNTAVSVSVNQWTHLAMTANGSTVKLYLNGAEVYSNSSYTRNTAGSTFHLGGTHVTNEVWSGSIDQVKVWSAALTTAEVQASMHTYSSSGIAKTLFAHFDFNSYRAGFELDRSGNGRSLTLAGSVASSNYSEARIVETGTAHTAQTYVKFNRTYLTATGGWTAPTGVSRYKALVVAGGGGGGFDIGGGGGGGGVIAGTGEFSAGVYLVTVGAGGFGNGAGIGGNGSGHPYSFGSTNGGDTTLIGPAGVTTLRAKGGGAGGSSYFDHTLAGGGSAGGSGGGTSGYSNTSVKSGGASTQATQGAATGVRSTTLFGNRGGQGGGQYYSGGGGGAGGIGVDSIARADGGPGIANAILGPNHSWAGGGGGSGFTIDGGNGGIGGGGGGAVGTTTGGAGLNNGSAGGGGARNVWANTPGGNGGANTGGGGGGGSHFNATNKGGNGGSGVLILSWGPYLEVSKSPTIARAGEFFNSSISLEVRDSSTAARVSTNSPIFVTASSNVLTLNGVLLTQSHTVNSVNGVVIFEGLGFASSVSGPVTLTFGSNSFVETTLVVTPTFVANNLVISSTDATTGFMSNGQFYASSSAGISYLRASDLVAHSVGNDIVLSVSGSISVSTGVAVTTLDRDLTLRAGSDIHVLGFTLQTNRGDLTLWSDADGNNSGAILTAANSQVRSQGGQILFTGGLNSTTGYAVGSALTQWGGVRIEGEVVSEGGDIVIRGDSGPNLTPSALTSPGWTAGVMIGPTTVSADVGRISISAKTNTNADTTKDHAGVAIGFGSAPGRLSTTTGDVDIRVDSAPASTAKRHGIAFWPAQITSTTGDISISVLGSLGTGSLAWDSLAGSQIFTSGQILLEDRGTTAASLPNITLSSSNQVIVRSNRLAFGSGAVITSSAQVTLESFGTSFSAAVSTANLSLGPRISGLVLGKTTNTSVVTVGGDIEITGSVTVSAQTITVATGMDLITTGLGSQIMLRATQWIDVVNNTITNVQGTDASFSTIQTNNGDITFWSDTDANQEGLIWISHNTRVNAANGVYSYASVSGGGDITLAGGADNGAGRPAGHAWDSGTRNGQANLTDVAVGFGKFVDVFTGGGDLIIRASKKVAGGLSAFHFQTQGEFVTGLGQIIIEAMVTGSGNVEAFEFFQDNETEAGALFSSHAAATPAISMSARISGTAPQAIRLYTQNSANPTTIQSLANSGGGVSITSNLGSTSTNTGTWLAAVNVLSKTGAITFSSNAVVSFTHENFTQHWGQRSGTSVSSSVADINIVANGVIGNQRSSTFSTSGAVRVLPFGSNFGANINWWPLVQAGSFTLGVDSGFAAAVHDIIFYNNITTTGEIRVYARSIDIDVGNDFVTTGNGSGITLKAADFIEVSDGNSNTVETGLTRLQTNRGDLIIWSDADNNGLGDVRIGWYAKLNTANGVEDKTSVSGGGDIVIAGGADANLDGRPDGSARGRSGVTWAIALLPHLEIYSGGGDIFMRGQSNSSYGVLAYPVTEIFSGIGVIDLTGESTANGRGFAFIDYDLDNNFNDFINIVSHASSSPAVRITGASAGATAEGLRLYGSGGSNLITIASTAATGGGVELIGRQTGGGSYSIYLRRINLLSAAGDITVDGGAKITSLDLASTEKNRNFGSVAGNAYVPTSSANITFISDNFGFDADTSNYRLSGDVKFLPFTNNYFADLSGTGYQVFQQSVVGPRSLTIGKPPLAGDINRDLYIRNNQSVSGEIKIHSGNIIVGDGSYVGDLNAGSTVSLVARGNIALSEDITTQGGNIWIQSRSTDAIEGGVITSAANFVSNGGHILISGGSSPYSSYAIGTAEWTQYLGVSLDFSTTINSGAGDITIRGSQGQDNDPNDGAGAYLSNAQISATSGNIRIYGRLADQPFTATDAEHSGILTYAATIATTTGDIELVGDATSITGAKADKRGLLLWPITVTSQAGDISVSGEINSVGVDSSDIQVVTASTFRSTTGTVHMLGRGAGQSLLFETTMQSNTRIQIESDRPAFYSSTVLTGSSSVFVESRGSSFATIPALADLVLSSTLTGLTLGKQSESGAWSLARAVTINGPISVFGGSIAASQPLVVSSQSATLLLSASGLVSNVGAGGLRSSGEIRIVAGAASLSATVSAPVSGGRITITSDALSVSAEIAATTSGRVLISPRTNGRGIVLGAASSSALAIASSANPFFKATTLQFGSGTTGDITVAANTTFSSANVTNLRLITPGSVTATNGAILTAQNLAITAGGGVNLPANNSATVVAISASSMVTYSSAVSYSPSTVDGVTPIFGIGTAMSQTNSPSVEQANEFLAVTFNPPPRIAITDFYGKVLDGNNNSAYQYSVSASVASGSGTVTGLTTSSRVGGLVTFTDIKVTSGVGVYAFTFSASLSPVIFTARSVDYNVMAGEPGQLAVIASTTSAPAGKTGLNFTITVRDAFGNAITAGDHKNITVSVSISGTTATLVSGGQVRANDSGIATFSNLVVSGSVSDTITITFRVTFSPLAGGTATVTSSATTITLTPGDATRLAVTVTQQSAANRSTMSQLAVVVQDSSGNTVLSQSDSVVATLVTSASNTLVGTTTVALPIGANSPAIATFSNLAIRGLVGTQQINFALGSGAAVATISHQVTLTPGSATRLNLDTAAAGARAGLAFTTQPSLSLRDADNNVVPGVASVSATLVAPTLSGTSTVALESGYATFSNLAYSNTAATRTMSYRVTAPANLTSLSTSQALTLTAGVPYKMVWLTSFSNQNAATDQNAARVAHFQDEWNNITSQSSTISVQLQLVSSTDSNQILATRATFTVSPFATSVSPTSAHVRVTTVGSYRFKAVSTGLVDALSNTFSITNASPSKLVVIQDVPATIRSGMTLSPVVRMQMQDVYGNPVIDKSLSVSATVISGSAISIVGNAGALISGSSFIEMPDLSIEAKASNLRIRYAVTAIYNDVSISSQVFAVTFGQGTQLSVSRVALTVANRVTLNSILVSVLDSAGNLVADSAANITAAAAGLTVTGNDSVFASSGVANFNALTLSGTVGTYDLGFSAPGHSSATTSVTITHGAAASVTITSSATAKNEQTLVTQPVVRILDADGNLVTTGGQSTQTVELIVSPGTITGTRSISASGGIATFSGIALEGTAGSLTLTGRVFTPSTLAANQVITLGFGNATKLTLETQAAGAVNGVALTTQPILKLRDSSDNEVTGVAHNVVATITPAVSSSGTTVAVNTTTATATFTTLSLSGTVGSYSISYSIEGASSSDVASVSQSIELTHGAAVNLRVVSQPTSGIAGITLSPLVIDVIDARGNRVTTGPTSSKTISITSAFTGTTVFGTKALSLSAGVATFDNLSVDKAETFQRLSFQVVGFTAGNTTNFVTTAGAATKLGFTGYSLVDKVAGQNQTNDSYVRLLDKFGNFATATDTVSITVRAVLASDTSSVSRTLPTYTLSAGASGETVLKNALPVFKVGTFQFKASATGLEDGFTNQFTITNAAASQLVITRSVPSTIQSGLTFSPAVRLQVQDAHGNPVINATYSASVSRVVGTISAIAGGLAESTLGSSFIEFPDLALTATNGSTRIRFTTNFGSPFTVDTANFTVASGAPFRLSVSPTTQSVANRVAMSDVVVRVLDAAGNIVTGSTKQVSAGVSGISLSGTSNVYSTNGIASFSGLVLTGQVGTYDLGFTSTGLLGATVSVTVTHGTANQIQLSVPASTKNAKTTSAVTAVILDADGNRVSTSPQSTQTITLTSSGTTLSGTVAISALAGIATFSNVALTGPIGTKSISATIQLPGVITQSQELELTFGDPFRLDLTTNAAGFVNRVAFDTAPVITVRDVSGNSVPTSGMDIRVTVSSASISGSTTASAATGVASFASNLTLRGLVGTHTLTFTAEGTSSSGVVTASQVVNLTHGAASELRLVRSSATVLSGAQFGVQPTFELLDPEGNLVTTGAGAISSIEATVSGNGFANGTGDANLSGTVAISASAGLATYSNLVLTGRVASYTLSYVVPGTNMSTSEVVALAAGPATDFRFIQVPTNVVAGETFSPAVSAEIIDAQGNRVLTAGNGVSVNVVWAVNSVGNYATNANYTPNQGLLNLSNLSISSAATYALRLEMAGSTLQGVTSTTSPTFIVSPAAVSKIELASGTQPVFGLNNQAFGTQPGFVFKDRFGNQATNAGNITVSAAVVSANAGNVIRVINSTVQSGGGAGATFIGLGLEASVSNYVISFSAELNGNIFASVASQPIEVRHGVATQIAITRNTADVLSGIDFATQPRVELRDSAGNRVSTTAEASSDLTVSYAGADWTNNQTGVDFTGTKVISFSAGIATFTDLRLSGKVGSYTLNYTSAINSNISVSEVLVVEPGNATKISQLQGPQDVVAGEQFGTALRVQILDAYDNRVTRLTESTTVVAKLFSSASNVLETSAEFGADGGVVTFSGLVFTSSGVATVRYEVGANSSVSPLASTTSATFTITHAAPDSIQWLYLPASTVQNDFIIEGVGASRPQLIAKDRFGNVVDTGTVKISVSSIVGTPQLLTGGQVDAVSGSATIQSLKLRATVGNYTLRFAASTLANSTVFSSISHVIEVTPGVADSLQINAGHPTTARSNIALSPQPEIRILDSAQNLVSSSAGVINVTVQGASHAGQTSLAAASGVAAFSTVKLSGSASSVVTLSYALQGTDISASRTLTLAAGAAVSFDLDWTAANIQTRAAINPAPKLILRDADGNKVLSDASTQGVAKLMRYGALVTESDLVTAASGEINFAGLTYIATPGGGYSLRFEAGVLPVVTTSDFVVLPGPVSQLEIQIQPSTSASITALTRTGESLQTQPKIRLLDVDGNLVTTVNSGTVTAAIASGVGGQLLTASATIVNGVATFTELGLIGRVETPTQSAEVYTLQFGYGGFSTSPSIGISVMHNVATQISLLTPAAGGRSGLTFTTKPQVVLLDRFGNRVFRDAAESLVASPTLQSGSGAPGVVNDDQGARDNAGVYTFDMGISGLVGNTYGLTFYRDGGGLTTASQAGITITHGNAWQIGFVTLPSSTDSNQVRSKTGEALKVQPVVEIQDAVGNRVLTSTQMVTATLESTVRGARDYLVNFTVSAVAGIATFNDLRMVVDPSSTYRLNFAYNQNKYTAPVQLQVTHADAEYLTIATSPDGGNKTGASLSRSPIITVHDFDGNLTTSLNGASISALIASGGGSVVVDGNDKALVQGGIAQFSNLKIVALPGVAQKLLFSLVGFNNSASATVTSTESNPISVTFSDAYKLSVFQQPCTGAGCTIGGTAELLSTQPVVEVQDFYGNRVTDFVGSITVTAQGTDGHLRDANARIASVDAVVASGLATFNSLRLEGRPRTDYTLGFARTGLVSTTSHVIRVKNTVANYLAITTQPLGGVTGAVLATQPVVEVRDRFDNVVVDYSGTIQASVVSGPNRVGNVAPVVSGSATATVTTGVATFNGLRLIGLVNRDYVLGFSDGTRSVSSQNVSLAAASAAMVELVNTPTAFRTGDLLTTQPVLRVLDFDGNLAVSTSVTITAGVVSGGGYIESGTVSSAVTGGYVTFSSLVLVAPVGVDQQLSFTATTADGSFSVNTTTALNVRHTDIAYFQVQTPYVSGNYQQGAVLPVQPKLFGFDRYGNKAIFDNSTVVTAGIGSVAGGAVSGSATATVTAGEVQFSGLGVTGSPGVAYKLNFNANLVTGAYSLLNPDSHTVFKTAAIQLAYPLTVFSLSATVAPTVALTDSTEHAPVYTTTTPQFCSVNSATAEITMLGAGSCVIRSTVANGTYYRSNTLDVTLPIAKADQAPLVLQSANNVNFGSVLTLAATGGSSTAPIEFASTGRCVILGDKLMPIGNATEGAPACTLLVLRAGDANFNEADVLRIPITVNRIAQAPLSIGNSRDATVGEVDLFTVGGSGTGTVSYQVLSQTGTQCSVVGNVLTSTGNGVCEISASKAQDQNYNLASSPAASFTFSKQVQQISFTSLPPSMPLPGQVYQASATASSGLTVSFAITMGQGSSATSQSAAVPAVCSISGSEVQFLRSGNCEITATQAGNSVFAAASVALRINVGTLNQFITFPMIEDSVFGSPALRLSAVASSELPVSYTVSAGITACTVTNGLVNFLAAGDCEIIATQAGNSSYAAAPPKSRAFKITPDKASAPALVSAAVGNQWFTLRYTQPGYNGGSNILGYRLEVLDQSSNSAGVYVNTACTTLTCTMAGIPNNRPYVARIAAITAAGVGQFSQYSRTMTPTAAQMGVTELAADVSAAGLDLTWNTPAAVEGNFSRYEVFVWVTGSTEPQTASAVVTNSASSTISVPISSISSGVQIAPASSNRVAVIQPAMNITSRLFIFGSQATRPMGFVSLASVQSQTTASATVGYSMKVVTITDTFSSSMTINTANGLKIGLETPAAPTQLGLDTSDPSKILVTWAAPLSDGGFAIEDYKVVVNGQTICANIQTRVCEISPLNFSTTYNVEVFARNALGFGAAAVASHTTPTPPPVIITDTRTAEALVRIPQLTSFTPKFARAGELVEVSGRKVNSITGLQLGDVDLTFTALNDSTLRFRVPVNTKPGTYDIQHFSEFGKVSVIDALVVIAGAVPTISPEIDTQSPVTPTTGSPSTESPVDQEGTGPLDAEKPTDSEQGGGSNGGSGGSNHSGSEGSGSEGRGSEGSGSGDGAGEGDSDGGESEPGEVTESEIAGPEPVSPTGQNPLWWILWLAVALAVSSYWFLKKPKDQKNSSLEL